MVLVTGGAGYIGTHAVKLLLERGEKVVVFDNFSRGYKEALEVLQEYGDLEFVNGDLRKKEDIKHIFMDYDIEGVMHFAALCLVNESMENPYLYFDNNVVGSLNLLDCMLESEVENLIFSSTAAVYGKPESLPVKENCFPNPTNTYGESKLMVERIIKWYGKIRDLNYIIFRYFNVCGADSDGVIGDSKKPSQLLVQNVVRGAMDIEPFYLTCSKVDTKDGTPIRDWIDVEDLVKAHWLGYKYLQNNKGDFILNLGNGSGWSVKEIISEVEDVFEVTIEAKKGEIRKGEDAEIYADISKVQKVLGWKPEKSLEDSILSLKNWYEKYPNGWNY